MPQPRATVSPAAFVAGRPRHRLGLTARERLLGYALLLPALLTVALVIVYPVLDGIRISFLRMKLTSPGPTRFVGLDNYAALLRDETFWQTLRTTAIWTASNLVAQVTLGTALALLLNERLRARGVYRAVALIPYVVPSVAAALIWRWLFDGSSGLFNAALVRLGVLDRFVPWLGEAGTALPAVVLESVWKGTPFVMLVVLAGVQAIPRELYEAGALDGATAAARFRYITLPLLRPTLGVATILTAVYTVNNFNAIWLMTQGGPLHSTEILFTLAYKAAFQRFDFGMAATISVVLFGLLALATAAYLFLVERDEEVAL
ncbi:MAG TPA: sugar ABC transporter permease [Thermomicrobiales bacterium]|nr:sugar ABC transporter permease [Thermomicrobiales bacterium]